MTRLEEIIRKETRVAFSGARGCLIATMAVKDVVQYLHPQSRVIVGCAGGVDGIVRVLVPKAEVFYFGTYYKDGISAAAAMAIRSTEVVKELNGGLLIAAPAAGQVCPASVVPAKSWKSGKSGTWSSIALALGLGSPVLLFLTSSDQIPPWMQGKFETIATVKDSGTWLLVSL